MIQMDAATVLSICHVQQGDRVWQSSHVYCPATTDTSVNFLLEVYCLTSANTVPLTLDTDQNSGKLSSKHHLLFIGIKMLLKNHILFTSYNCIIFIFAKIKKTSGHFFTNFILNIFLSFSSSSDDYCLLFIATGDILSRFVTVPQFTFTVYYRILTGWLDSFFGSTFDKGNSLDFSKAHRLESLILWHL